jgi:DNA invertase Pin-like site-specific DNA recombinase
VNTSTPIKLVFAARGNIPKTVPNRIGYARVSSIGQNLDSQMDSLKQAGCIKIFTDKLTGSRMDRPGWAELLEYIRPGDILVVTRPLA